ncbi:MAG: hypothetical protein IK093_05680 [Ruminiclostridium sp.]|nr:hypothetical protein [Ruminiclostridium sp.]
MTEEKKPVEIDDDLMDAVAGGIMPPETGISDAVQEMQDQFNQTLQAIKDQISTASACDPIKLSPDNGPVILPGTPVTSDDILKPMDLEEIIKKHGGL